MSTMALLLLTGAALLSSSEAFTAFTPTPLAAPSSSSLSSQTSGTKFTKFTNAFPSTQTTPITHSAARRIRSHSDALSLSSLSMLPMPMDVLGDPSAAINSITTLPTHLLTHSPHTPYTPDPSLPLTPLTLLRLLLHQPTLWSILAMTSIVTLLISWETTIEKIKHNTPKPIIPVIDSMLAEVGGLGFIGLFLSIVVTGGPVGEVVGKLSEEFLGEEELLLETFEFLHTFFFEVGIVFFGIAGVVVGAVLGRVQKLSEISALALDADGDGEVTLEELAEALEVESLLLDEDGDGFISEEEKVTALRTNSGTERSWGSTVEEYFFGDKERAGECLVVRERMMDTLNLPEDFAIEKYFTKVFAHNLEEIVELSPVTWLPLIPLIAVSNSVDLARDVVSAASENAFESCGFFYATPWVLIPTFFFQGLSLVWAIYNFWKMASIKKMLLPTLVKDSTSGEAFLLPPRYQDDYLLHQFQSSGTDSPLSPLTLLASFFQSGERLFSQGGSTTSPPRNAHEQLFGAVGSQFPTVFRNSIQFHTWLCVAQIVYSLTEIVSRDVAALYLNAEVGNAAGLVPELALWSGFVALQIFQLTLAPTTFLNYCFITSVEEYVEKDVIKSAILDERVAALERREEKEMELEKDGDVDGSVFDGKRIEEQMKSAEWKWYAGDMAMSSSGRGEEKTNGEGK